MPKSLDIKKTNESKSGIACRRILDEKGVGKGSKRVAVSRGIRRDI